MMNVRDRSAGWTTSLGLLGQMQQKGDKGWERFTELYSILLNYWFEQDGVSIGDWADLRQDVYLAVAKRLPEFEYTPGEGSFRGWLRVIARNKVADYRRKRFPVADSELVDNRPAEEPDEAGTEKKMLFKRALDLIRTDFEAQTWQAFWLVEVEDRRPTEVAHTLGIKLASVYVNKSRVLHRLREEFASLLRDEPPRPPSQT